MKLLSRVWLAMLFILPMLAASPCRAQTETQTADKSTAVSPDTDAQKKNLQAYIDLLRKDIRQQKAEIMGAVMVLSADDAAKFWPIYRDRKSTRLNSSHGYISYAVFCLKKKKTKQHKSAIT